MNRMKDKTNNTSAGFGAFCGPYKRAAEVAEMRGMDVRFAESVELETQIKANLEGMNTINNPSAEFSAFCGKNILAAEDAERRGTDARFAESVKLEKRTQAKLEGRDKINNPSAGFSAFCGKKELAAEDAERRGNYPVDLVNPVKKGRGRMDPILGRIYRIRNAQRAESAELEMRTKAKLEGLDKINNPSAEFSAFCGKKELAAEDAEMRGNNPVDLVNPVKKGGTG